MGFAVRGKLVILRSHKILGEPGCRGGLAVGRVRYRISGMPNIGMAAPDPDVRHIGRLPIGGAPGTLGLGRVGLSAAVTVKTCTWSRNPDQRRVIPWHAMSRSKRDAQSTCS